MNLYGLIGYPLGHSFSKKYFTKKFENEGLGDCFFELFPLPSIHEFSDLLRNNSALKGLAVTIPHKQTILPFLDTISPEAAQIGAVNCIQFKGNILMGYNTDVVGFEKSFMPLLHPHHKKALVLGTGGASKAVQYILSKHAIPFTLVSRGGDGETGIINYDTIDQQVLNDHQIIINCSPLGMSPNEKSKPELPYEYITDQHLLYDLVYGPVETAFLSEGKKRGALIKDGYEMLELQAEENWRVWNNQDTI